MSAYGIYCSKQHGVFCSGVKLVEILNLCLVVLPPQIPHVSFYLLCRWLLAARQPKVTCVLATPFSPSTVAAQSSWPTWRLKTGSRTALNSSHSASAGIQSDNTWWLQLNTWHWLSGHVKVVLHLDFLACFCDLSDIFPLIWVRLKLMLPVISKALISLGKVLIVIELLILQKTEERQTHYNV